MEFDYRQQPGLIRWEQGLVNTQPPLVSIITPYYNGGNHIRQTCNCVLDQTFPYFEWIIVDDGSTQKADVALLEEIGARDPRIRVFHKENGGISTARNFGIRQARTELILPLDDDDLLEPTFLEYCWWMLEKNPGAAWAYSESAGFQGQEYLWKKRFDPVQMKTENLLTATALIRKEALLAIGGYEEGRKHYNEDWYAWLKMIARGGYPAQSTGEYLFWYRRKDTGVLSLVKTDRQIAKENQKLIASAAKEIRRPPAPVIYPSPSDRWALPKRSEWKGCVYKQKTKIHVALLLPHLEMGGADKFNLDFLEGLDRTRFDVSVLTTNPGENAWQQRFRRITPNIFNLPNFMTPEDYGEFVSYYLISRQVDVLFVSNSYHGYYLIPWLREQFPQLAIVDYVHMEEWYWRSGGYARTSAMVGAVTEKTYVCNSATREVMLRHFGRKPETVETVHIGVDQGYFDRNLVEPGTLYRELGIPQSRPIALFICRLHPQKRPFLMLEIAKKVAARLPEAAFAVVGDGPQGAELREKANQMGLQHHVFFLGARKDVRPCYRDARLTLVCSLKEGLSLTAYESCAMGVPVVSADVGGQRDLIDDTVGALIPCLQSESEEIDSRRFAPEEVEAYSQAIVTLLTDDRLWEEKSRRSRERIEKAFTIQGMTDYFRQELERLTTDDSLKQQRNRVSQALVQCSPLAAELFAMELQLNGAETDGGTPGGPPGETLIQRAKRAVREGGVSGFVKKALRWGWRKAKGFACRR